MRKEPKAIGQALGINFRPYQLEALSHMVQSTRGIIQHPTGSGKTLIAAAIAGFIGRQTLYVVPTIDLLNQTYDVFCKIFGERRIGKIGDGETKFAEINIAVVNSLYNILQNIDEEDKKVIVSAQIDVLRFCIKRNMPVALLEYSGRGETIAELKKEIDNVLKHEYVEKKSNDGFCETNLNSLLHDLGIEKVCLMGINASYCVKETGEGALVNGFEIMTADPLIVDSSGGTFNGTKAWFTENGTYFSNHQQLLEAMVGKK